jgi:hypothetical protein
MTGQNEVWYDIRLEYQSGDIKPGMIRVRAETLLTVAWYNQTMRQLTAEIESLPPEERDRIYRNNPR